MIKLTDQHLLCDYAEHRSEAAFSELVRRHVDLIHSAALRMVCDAHLAKDVTQNTFVALAQNARQLTGHPILSGWLHRTAQNLAAKVVRFDVRRRAREQEAVVMNELLSAGPDANWENIAPHLDAALGELSEPDRDAVLLRYFERKSASEMAQVLGISDEAAQKRVSRAVERLHEFFAKRGATVGASGLVLVISANAVQAAPVGLAFTISTAAALTATALATTTTVTATTTIAMTALQKALVAGVIITAGLTTPFILQHQAKVRLREENQSLRQQMEQLTGLQAENDRLSNLLAQATSSESRPSSELLRLRGEVGLLRRQTNDLGKLQEENQRLRAVQSQHPVTNPASPPAKDDFPRETWTFAGYADPESAVLSLVWAGAGADLENYLNSMTPRQQSEEREKWQRSNSNDTEAREQIAKELGGSKRIRILDKETLSENEVVLTLFVEQEDRRHGTSKVKMQRIGNEWKFAGRYRLPPQEAP